MMRKAKNTTSQATGDVEAFNGQRIAYNCYICGRRTDWNAESGLCMSCGKTPNSIEEVE